MMKHFFQILALLTFMTVTPVASSGEVVDRIVAIVNDDVITLSEVNEEGKPLFRRIAETAPVHEIPDALKLARKQVVDKLIDKKIILQEAEKAQLTVSDEEVEKAFEQILDRNNATHDDFIQQLSTMGMTEKQYREDLKNATRGIAIINDQYAVVRDELETKETETTIRWNMLTSAEVKITGENTAEFNKDGKKLLLKVTKPEKVNMKIWSTVPSNDYDAPNPGTLMAGFEINIPANTKAVLNVLLLPDGAVEDPAVSSVPLSKWPKDNIK